MPYCMYLRKSRADMEAETHGEGETLARHEKILSALAEKLNLNVLQIYREIVSGETISARPVMQRLLKEVAQGIWDGVLVMEIERLARGDTIDQGIVAQTFKFSGTKIITPIKIFDPCNEYDEEYFEFGLFMSRREYKTINRRLQRGRLASVKEGKYVGNKTPYGYLRKKLENEKGFTLAPDPEKAPILKMIFHLYAYGDSMPDGQIQTMGVSRIVRKLNMLKISPTIGDAWTNATIQQMLRNPVYHGKIRWNGRPLKKKFVNGQMVKERPRAKPEDWVLCEGLHEALVDDKTWEIVQNRIARHESHPAPKNMQTKNPLAGLIICGKCGRRMVRRPYTNRIYADTIMCPVTSCDNISSALDLVENRVLEALTSWLRQYKLNYKSDHPARINPATLSEQALASLQNDLEKLQAQRDKIYSLLEQGIYTTEVFLQRSSAVNSKIEEEKESIKKLQSELQTAKLAVQDREKIIPRAEQVLAEYSKAQTAAEKNELLKSMIEKVVYTKTVNGRWQGKPDDFELILYPKLPKGKSFINYYGAEELILY